MTEEGTGARLEASARTCLISLTRPPSCRSFLQLCPSRGPSLSATCAFAPEVVFAPPPIFSADACPVGSGRHVPRRRRGPQPACQRAVLGPGAAFGLHPGRECPDPRPRKLPHAVRAAPADRPGEAPEPPGVIPSEPSRRHSTLVKLSVFNHSTLLFCVLFWGFFF